MLGNNDFPTKDLEGALWLPKLPIRQLPYQVFAAVAVLTHRSVLIYPGCPVPTNSFRNFDDRVSLLFIGS